MSEFRRATATAAGAAAFLMLALAAPAWAGYGAIAYDQFTGKEGASWNQPTQSKADEEALRQCASADCRVHPVDPRGCGALARSSTDKAWGGADRVALAQAKKDAVAHCQTHTTTGTCAVAISGCNE